MAIQRACCWLTIRGEHLEPAQVTCVLLVEADSISRKGEERINRKTGQRVAYPDSTWSVESEKHVAGPRLEEHLRWLLSAVKPESVVRVPNVESVSLTVFIDSDNDYEGLVLDTPVVEFAAAIHAEIHVYVALVNQES